MHLTDLEPGSAACTADAKETGEEVSGFRSETLLIIKNFPKCVKRSKMLDVIKDSKGSKMRKHHGFPWRIYTLESETQSVPLNLSP